MSCPDAVNVGLTFALILVVGCERDNERPMQSPVSDMKRINATAESDTNELVKQFLSGEKDTRQEAALALGERGSDECIEPMLAALSDDDDYVRSSAMRGIERGIAANRCTKGFLDAMFPALVKQLDRDDRSVSGESPALLLAIDSARAIPVLLSPQYFTTQNSQLHYILRALNNQGYKVPHDKLLPLLADLKPRAEKYPHDYDYAECLIAYGRNPNAAAEKWIRVELNSANETVRRGAGEALTLFSGLSKPFDHVCELMESKGFDGLTDPQQHFYAVSIYHWEVDNGGHSQYFFNSSGDHWKSAQAGLKAIGAVKRAKILEEAASRFGPNGPSSDRMTRIMALGRLEEQGKRSFDDLDDRFYAADEDFDVLLPLYAIEFKSHFTKTWAEPQQEL